MALCKSEMLSRDYQCSTSFQLEAATAVATQEKEKDLLEVFLNGFLVSVCEFQKHRSINGRKLEVSTSEKGERTLK